MYEIPSLSFSISNICFAGDVLVCSTESSGAYIIDPHCHWVFFFIYILETKTKKTSPDFFNVLNAINFEEKIADINLSAVGTIN